MEEMQTNTIKVSWFDLMILKDAADITGYEEGADIMDQLLSDLKGHNDTRFEITIKELPE
jgi:hypothetical protein